ncbi:MAG: 30S ribosomal protein S2 [Patescibacteria group bacterium]
MATDVDPVKNITNEELADKTKSTPETKRVSKGVDIKKLLEAGAHFGHKTSRWHPKMAPYIHSKRGGTHIIDLVKTVEQLERALAFLEETAGTGKQILVVGTKRQAQDIVRKLADETSMPFVTERWLGGMLTNRNTIGGRIKHLKDLEEKMANGALAAKYSKLEVQRFQEEIDEMNHLYGGIKDLAIKPGAMFVTDVNHNLNAVREAVKLGVPVVAIVDTNADPTLIDYPIPANDDAIKTIQLVADYVQAAIESGKAAHAKKQPAADKPEPKTAAASKIKPEAEPA